MSEEQRAADGLPSLALVPMPAEIDIVNATRLAAELDAAIKPGVTTLVVDMTLTTFCDSLGVKVIARTRRRAEEEGVDLRLVTASPHVLRILAATGLDATIPVYGRLDAALTADSEPASEAPG